MASFVALEKHAFFLLFLGFVLILFWIAVWGLVEEWLEEFRMRNGWTKKEVYSALLLSVIAIFAMYPRLLQRV